MANSEDKPKRPKKHEVWRARLDFIFGFENKRGEVIDSWLRHADNFTFSTQEFYANVEAQLAARKIPGMAIARQEFPEGSLLSDQRLYLRLLRERLAITICAAPFGKMFFFSCRTVHVPALVRLWHILAALAFFFVVGRLLIMPLGLTFGTIAAVTLLFALAGVLRNASAGVFSDLDALLLRIPVVATFYEDWFREETYYRQDTRSLYLKVLPALVQEIAEESCASKGVKLETDLQRVPAIADLTKTLPTDKKPTAT